MSKATDRIAYYWFGQGDDSFLTPASMMTEEDQPLIDAGVFVLSKEERHTIYCPFGCGQMEQIQILPRLDREGDGHFVFCSDSPESMELEPRDYQLYAFNSAAFLRYGNQAKKEKPKHRNKVRPKNTKWIVIEREAVMDYANDPKLNKFGKEPHELCHTVWARNREDFEKAASLPVDQRGYRNEAALRSYFYWNRSKYQARKYGKAHALIRDN